MTPSEIEALYRRYGHVVVRRAEVILGSRADAEELAQDLFESFLERPPSFEGRSSIVTYLYRVTTNRALNHLRDGRNRMRLVSEAARDDDGVGATLEARVLARQVLASLPEEQAVAAVHAYVDGMSHAEIAEILCCSRRHVGDLLERVTAKLAPLEEAS